MVPVDVLDGQAGELAESDAGIDQEEDDRAIPALVESLARCGVQQLLEGLRAEDVRRCLRDRRRLHPGHRRLPDLALVDEPPEELLQAAVTVRSRGQPETGKLVFEERLDMLAVDRRDAPRHSMGLEEGIQAGHGVQVRLDRVRTLVRRPEVAGEGRRVGRDVRGCGRLGRADRCYQRNVRLDALTERERLGPVAQWQSN